MEDIIKQRAAILSLLYRARQDENKHLKGFVKENDISNSCGECSFNLGILVELGHIKQDGYQYRITGTGAVAHETAQCNAASTL